MYTLLLFLICIFVIITLCILIFYTSTESYHSNEESSCTDKNTCQQTCGTSNSWEGWATTTKFYDTETCWPQGLSNAINLKCIESKENAMGAALPWRILCKTYGSRQNLLDQLAPILYDGKSDDKKQCFEIQPISVPPNQIIQGSFDSKGFGTKFDINDPLIAAKDSTGKEYPVYIIYPFEGCGGNCKTCPDCFNNCYASLTSSDDIKKILGCDFSTIDESCCNGMKTLWKDDWSPDNKDAFLKDSDPFAINDTGDFDKTSTTVNWCSGFNYHFDLAVESPLWSNITPSETNGPYCKSKGDLDNIVIRYRKINCPVLSDCQHCK